MIRLGVCTGPDKIGQAAELGFEFIECGFAWLSSLTDTIGTALDTGGPIDNHAINSQCIAS